MEKGRECLSPVAYPLSLQCWEMQVFLWYPGLASLALEVVPGGNLVRGSPAELHPLLFSLMAYQRPYDPTPDPSLKVESLTSMPPSIPPRPSFAFAYVDIPKDSLLPSVCKHDICGIEMEDVHNPEVEHR